MLHQRLRLCLISCLTWFVCFLTQLSLVFMIAFFYPLSQIMLVGMHRHQEMFCLLLCVCSFVSLCVFFLNVESTLLLAYSVPAAAIIGVFSVAGAAALFLAYETCSRLLTDSSPVASFLAELLCQSFALCAAFAFVSTLFSSCLFNFFCSLSFLMLISHSASDAGIALFLLLLFSSCFCLLILVSLLFFLGPSFVPSSRCVTFPFPLHPSPSFVTCCCSIPHPSLSSSSCSSLPRPHSPFPPVFSPRIVILSSFISLWLLLLFCLSLLLPPPPSRLSAPRSIAISLSSFSPRPSDPFLVSFHHHLFLFSILPPFILLFLLSSRHSPHPSLFLFFTLSSVSFSSSSSTFSSFHPFILFSFTSFCSSHRHLSPLFFPPALLLLLSFSSSTPSTAIGPSLTSSSNASPSFFCILPLSIIIFLVLFPLPHPFLPLPPFTSFLSWKPRRLFPFLFSSPALPQTFLPLPSFTSSSTFFLLSFSLFLLVLPRSSSYFCFLPASSSSFFFLLFLLILLARLLPSHFSPSLSGPHRLLFAVMREGETAAFTVPFLLWLPCLPHPFEQKRKARVEDKERKRKSNVKKQKGSERGANPSLSFFAALWAH